MKVLMATMQLDIGGAETHIVELSKALTRKGVEVIVASKGGAYVAELEEAGIRHFNVELNSKNIFSIRRAYKALERIIMEEKVDIVHAHARIPGFICGLLQKKYKFRFVTTAHWVFSTRFPFNLLTNWGDRSLAVSDDIKQYLIDNYGIKDENIRVTINGIDTEKFSDNIDYSDIAEEFCFGENKTRIIYVSRMDIDRSLAAHKLIEAVPALYKDIPNLEVVIVGGGNDFESIKKEAESVNKEIGERVVITTGGRIDINKFAASGDVFVGVSRAALEAMACKKPAIIAGNEGYIGIFDKDKLDVAIDTNFCCRGCGETTAERLKDDLLALLAPGKEQWRKELGEYALSTVEKYYSVDTMANDAIKMYISIVKERPINEVSHQELEGIEKYLSCGSGRRNVDVAISGYYGFRNSGDDSILRAIIDDLRDACPNISITVLSQRPVETAREYKVNSVDRFDFFTLWGLLKRTKLLISGGGSLIQDVTSSKSLFYYLSVIKLAKLRGAKVMLYANGIGPLTKQRNLKHVKKTLEKVDYITLREDSSMDELLKVMPKSDNCEVTADPVFNARVENGEIVDKAIKKGGIETDEKFFVISMRSWRTLDPNVVDKISQFGDWVYRKYKIKPFVIPMQRTFDRSISNDIEEHLSVPHGICRDGYSPQTMMGIIGRAEFVLGMRLHTLIYAVKMGVPGIAIDYDPKVAAVMEAIDFQYSETVDKIDVEKLCSYVDEIIENRQDLCEVIREKSENFRALAKKNTEMAIQLLRK
ncbi:MAG: polysaccharide pyruvyl transferase CsaB [Clostridia bacterium]|nr:polysaccharide pyruvyl transferase CsaB [Clostridia bacterium]